MKELNNYVSFTFKDNVVSISSPSRCLSVIECTGPYLSSNSRSSKTSPGMKPPSCARQTVPELVTPQLCWQSTVHFISFLLSSSHCPSLFPFILWARINCGAVCTRQLSELLNDPINYLLCSMERNFNCLLPKIKILYVCKNGRAFGLYPECIVRYIITQLIDC